MKISYKHPRFGYPGSETDINELAEFIRTLLEVGYLQKEKKGTLSFEIKPTPGESSLVIIEESKRKLHDAWKLV